MLNWTEDTKKCTETSEEGNEACRASLILKAKYSVSNINFNAKCKHYVTSSSYIEDDDVIIAIIN